MKSPHVRAWASLGAFVILFGTFMISLVTLPLVLVCAR